MKVRDRYVFYKNRPEWADVTPVPQDDNGRNVVKIAYSPQFVDAHDYMRAVLLKDERSERALEITATVLLLNPANYTVWEYRRRILTSLQSDLNEEVTFVSKLIDENSKNYQEVEFVQNIIRSAPANESSWNYLYGLLVPAPCVVAASGSHRAPPPRSTKLSSVRPDLASFNTSVDVVDEVAGDEVPPNSNLAKLVILPVSAANLRMMRTFAEKLAASDTAASTSVALHAFLVEVYTDCLQAKTSKLLSSEAVSNSDEVCNETRCQNVPENVISEDSDETVTDLLDLAVSTCERLATELDRIRAGYWRYRSRQLQAIGVDHPPPS
ncbi:protein farnesyltransferase/geranylgeranyltransferase type-1 subunit alpha [Paragonimus westermani]|uniref:Protein farnesyltransferase/geranylgeranyltransferase type-1 subunit alpha n=1 Tax=Paragonimus westermani TaxID=34504 RepID=A0A5J4P188_9TREM|nr:protein farnesyltransferase/geranylgeranyltransferase type-1 subunit alpha [Paragonimus westermani]